jgi:hypothetical protein
VSKAPDPRVSFAPLLRAAGCANAHSYTSSRIWGGDCWTTTTVASPLTTLAELLDVQLRQVNRWKIAGLRVVEAEDAATALGMHPFTIWGDEWLYAVLCPVAHVQARLGVAP